jgi:hypothetical protein
MQQNPQTLERVISTNYIALDVMVPGHTPNGLKDDTQHNEPKDGVIHPRKCLKLNHFDDSY